MVIEDNSVVNKTSNSSQYWPVASSTDRLYAFILDFLIMSPVIGLFSSLYLRDLKYYEVYQTSAFEVVATFLLMTVLVVFSAAFIQSVFLIFWQATPGQKFLYLKVVHFQSQKTERLTWGQALLRSFGWWFGAFFFFLPNIEILSHPLRRAFHDRLSDTIVINLKGQNSRPKVNEAQIVGNWLYLFFAGLFGLLFLFFVKIQEQTLEGTFSFSKSLREGLLCEAIDPEVVNYDKRIDLALSLFLTENISSKCLQKEADFVLWQRQSKYYPMAYLAKALLTEKTADQDFYEEKICAGQSKKVSEECAVVHFLKSESSERADELRKSGLKLLSSRVLLLQESVILKKYESALALVDDLIKNPDLESSINKYYVRLMWNLRDSSPTVATERAPASSKSSDQEFKDKAVKTFKERFDIE